MATLCRLICVGGILVGLVFAGLCMVNTPSTNNVPTVLFADATSDAPDPLESNASFYKLVLTEHVEDSAHPEASELVKCVENNNIYQTYKSRYNAKKYYLICQLQDKRWGVVPVILESANLVVKTAFVPKDGNWNTVLNYVTQEAVRFTQKLLITR
jgi:hypothetical protein